MKMTMPCAKSYYLSTNQLLTYLIFISQMQMVQGLNYIGCFKDSKERDLGEFFFKYYRDNTPEKCIEICFNKSTHYAAVQYAVECYCGNSYGRYGALNETSCHMDCSGDNTKTCGGGWANNVYKTATTPQLGVKEISSSSKRTVVSGKEIISISEYFTTSSIAATKEMASNVLLSGEQEQEGQTNSVPIYDIILPITFVVIASGLLLGYVWRKRRRPVRPTRPTSSLPAMIQRARTTQTRRSDRIYSPSYTNQDTHPTSLSTEQNNEHSLYVDLQPTSHYTDRSYAQEHPAYNTLSVLEPVGPPPSYEEVTSNPTDFNVQIQRGQERRKIS